MQRDNVGSKALPRYWQIRTSNVAKSTETDSLLDLTIFCALIRQVYNRRELEKESLFRQAVAFLISYAFSRRQSNPLEVSYNVGRAFHYLGMNTHA
jgi:hypothetical protein